MVECGKEGNERGKKRISFFLFVEKHAGLDVWFVKGRGSNGAHCAALVVVMVVSLALAYVQTIRADEQ